MKKLILILFVFSLTMVACSPARVYYQQIATLSSDNVKLSDDGKFAYEDGILTIEYNFWSEYGEFSFVVKNNSDESVYLSVAESFFIDNGYANDYYQGRTRIYTAKSSTSSNSSVSVGVAGHSGVTVDSGIAGGLSGTDVTLGASKGYGASKALASSSEKGYSVEFQERQVICIPAHSYKIFREFSVCSHQFEECGFISNPSKKEISIRNYSDFNSPKVLENRLVFKIGDDIVPITNVFYVTQYQNILLDVATEYVKVQNCDGSKREVKINKMSGRNKFYINYAEDEIEDNHRGPAKSSKSVKKNFRDGFYD